jgi:hypothetical protein
VRLPQNCGAGLYFPFVSPDASHLHITQPPISWPPRHYLVKNPHDVSCLALCIKLTWLSQSPSSELFYLLCQEILEFEFVRRFEKLSSAKPWGCHNWAAGHVSTGKGQGSFSWTECKILDCWNELKTLWCQKQTHGRQKILTRQFLLIKRVQARAHSSWPDTQAQNGWQWLLLISLMQLYLPLTWDLSRSKVHNPSQLAKRLMGWVRACNLEGNFHGQWDYTRIQKKQEPFKQHKSPKMATWGILNNLRWW